MTKNQSRSAILHIGTEKTGTTAIQTLLAGRRQELAELGFWYPSSLGESGHTALAICCAPENMLDHRQDPATNLPDKNFYERELTRLLAGEMVTVPSDVKTVIFSNEHCQSRLITNEQISRLRSMLAPYFETITVVVYLRRQDEMASSSYSTRLRGGESDFDILPYIPKLNESEEGAGDPVLARYFDFGQLLDRYAHVFGEQFIKPRIYEANCLIDGDVISDFLVTCGLPSSLAAGAIAENRAIPADGQRFLTVLNAYQADAICEWDTKLSTEIRDICAFIAEKRLSGRPLLPTRDEARRFYAQFMEMNEQVRLKWFPARPKLFSEDFERYPEFQGDYETALHAGALRASFFIIEELIRDKERVLIEMKALESAPRSSPPFRLTIRLKAARSAFQASAAVKLRRLLQQLRRQKLKRL